jgi:hypothetical protein
MWEERLSTTTICARRRRKDRRRVHPFMDMQGDCIHLKRCAFGLADPGQVGGLHPLLFEESILHRLRVAVASASSISFSTPAREEPKFSTGSRCGS